jgi:transposase-like protein
MKSRIRVSTIHKAAGGMIEIHCPRCGRFHFRTEQIEPGNAFEWPCRGCKRETRVVVPDTPFVRSLRVPSPPDGKHTQVSTSVLN